MQKSKEGKIFNEKADVWRCFFYSARYGRNRFPFAATIQYITLKSAAKNNIERRWIDALFCFLSKNAEKFSINILNKLIMEAIMDLLKFTY